MLKHGSFPPENDTSSQNLTAPVFSVLFTDRNLYPPETWNLLNQNPPWRQQKILEAEEVMAKKRQGLLKLHEQDVWVLDEK